MTDNLAYLLGKPTVTGNIRSQVDDFQVKEILPFEPDNDGEHLFIYIRKTNTNTLYVAQQLAKYFSVRENLVSYAGLKDRHAVTEQWFSVHLPGKTDYDVAGFNRDNIEVLTFGRHSKKLKSGALSGNQFTINIRQVSDTYLLEQRWQKIIKQGVPNYFGEQRFGIENKNLAQALAMFSGRKIKDKKKRGFYLSAARSHVFNHLVSQRITNGYFSSILAGDVMMLSGSRSIFLSSSDDEQLVHRLAEFDIDITAPMWGEGELASKLVCAEFELATALSLQDYTGGLIRFGLKQERRKIRLQVTQGDIQVNGDCVTLSFFLPAGCFATTILRELLAYNDVSEHILSTVE